MCLTCMVQEAACTGGARKIDALFDGNASEDRKRKLLIEQVKMRVYFQRDWKQFVRSDCKSGDL